MPRLGCRQCTKRRIVCDQGIPRCEKCIKKDIECSGIGKQYRFVQGVTSRKRNRPLSTSASSDLANNVSGSIPHSTQASCANSDPEVLSKAVQLTKDAESTLLLSHKPNSLVTSYDLAFDVVSTPLCPTIEVLKPGIRMLFDHFSNVIAPYMVVLDSGNNGYRNTILPLAYHYPLVQQAVSIVSAFHLSSKRPELLGPAEDGRRAIITKLQEDAFVGGTDEVFKVSTWATLVVLLVGETVTGSTDFVYIFKMLTLLVSDQSLAALSTPVSEFLLQQSRMFQLFTPPLTESLQTLEVLENQLDLYFDFLSLPSLLESKHFGTLSIIKEAIRQTFTMHRSQTARRVSPDTKFMMLERLKSLVSPITPEIPGSHALVWCYFIAAAGSHTLEHRIFFSQRLNALHNIGNFGNIPVALQTLRSIWCLEPDKRWTEERSLVAPILVI